MLRLFKRQQAEPVPLPDVPTVSITVPPDDPLPRSIGQLRFTLFENKPCYGALEFSLVAPATLMREDERKIDNAELLLRAYHACGWLPNERHGRSLCAHWNEIPQEWRQFTLVFGGGILWPTYIFDIGRVHAPYAQMACPQADGQWKFYDDRGFQLEDKTTRKEKYRFVRARSVLDRRTEDAKEA